MQKNVLIENKAISLSIVAKHALSLSEKTLNLTMKLNY